MALLFQSMEERLASKQRLVQCLCLKYCGCRVTRRSALGIVAVLWPHFAQNPAGPSLANEAGSDVATEGANMGRQTRSLLHRVVQAIEEAADSQLDCRMLMGPREEDCISKVSAVIGA